MAETDRRCEWDGHRRINELAVGAGIDRASPRWVLVAVDDGGTTEDFVDPRLDMEVHLVDNVIISITCRETFFVRDHPDNLIGDELWELASAVGHPFEPDAIAHDFIFEAEQVGLSCVVMDGRVSSISLADFDLIEDRPDAPRPVGAG